MVLKLLLSIFVLLLFETKAQIIANGEVSYLYIEGPTAHKTVYITSTDVETTSSDTVYGGGTTEAEMY